MNTTAELLLGVAELLGVTDEAAGEDPNWRLKTTALELLLGIAEELGVAELLAVIDEAEELPNWRL